MTQKPQTEREEWWEEVCNYNQPVKQGGKGIKPAPTGNNHGIAGIGRERLVAAS